MSDHLTVTCSRCESQVTHECHRWPDGEDEEGNRKWRSFDRRHHTNPLAHAFIELLMWRPEGGLPEHTVTAMKASDWYSAGDENRPFFSQSVMYSLLDWKDDARTFFSLLHALMKGAGFDVYKLQIEAEKQLRKKDLKSGWTRGGLVGTNELAEFMASATSWIPEVGWTVGLAAEGVGVVGARIVEVEKDDRGRGDWDFGVHFEGGGSCHFRRLLAIAHWVKDADGNQVYPPSED